MILRLFIVWRLGLLLVTYLGSKIFTLNLNTGLGSPAPGRNFDFWASWAQWDGGHYFRIASQGYIDERSFAFFPIYPYLIKYTSFIFLGNYVFSGLIISNLAALIFFITFHKLVSNLYSKKTATVATITIMTFPTTFFLGAMYPESLFLLLTTLAFFYYFLQKPQKAAFSISIAALTKFFGIFVVVSIILEQLVSSLKNKLSKKNIIWISLSAMPFLLYLILLFDKFEDPFKFLSVQEYWERKVTLPTTTVGSYLIPMLSLSNRPMNDYFDLLVTIIFFVLLLTSVKKIPFSVWFFSFIVLLIPISSGTLSSMPRYVLSSIGTFIIIAMLLEKSKKLSIFIWLISLTLQTLLAVLFVNGYWVA
ncbi:glycosyltransferase family 39 protein [Candidatus Curtissbacteria bacterium]|nr:glycosyltransferase family 39 protein [Candidatus Curtissbacteria bacterium]